MSETPEGVKAVPALTDFEFCENMSTSELLPYSLISPATRNNARRKWKVISSLDVCIGHDSLTLTTMLDDLAPIKFFWSSPNPESLLLEPPIVETAINENPRVALVKPDYTNMFHWLEHFSEFFHSKNVRLRLTSAESIFGINEIKKLFENYKIIGFIGTSYDLLIQLFTQFLPLKTIMLDVTPDADLTADLKPLVDATQDIDEIHFGKEFPMTVEKLKTLEKDKITILCPAMGLRGFNSWLKSWASLESNRNLAELNIKFPAVMFAIDYRRYVFHDIQFSVGQDFICNYPCTSKAWDYEPMISLNGPFIVHRGHEGSAVIAFNLEKHLMNVKFTVKP